MSHAETVIEPAEGLTVLAGPNNCGKSAVITALQTLCYNERGNFMMRHGASSCRVSIETDDGHVIEWERSKKSGVRYIIDGREVDRLRGRVPDDLHEKLRLPHVESVDGSDDFDIHFGEQKKPIFLLDQNGRQAATFFASSSDAALLVEMQAEHKRDVTEHRADERSLVKDIARCEKQLQPLQPIPEIDRSLATLEENYEQLIKSMDELSQLEARADELDRQFRQRGEYLNFLQPLAFLLSPPLMLDVKPLEQTVSRFDAANNWQRQENGRQTLLGKLASPPQIESTLELETLLKEFDEEAEAVARFNKRQDSLQPLIAPPSLLDEHDLEELIAELTEEQNGQRVLQRDSQRLEKLETPPLIADDKELTETVVELERAQEILTRIDNAHERLIALDPPYIPFNTLGLAEIVKGCETAANAKQQLSADLQSLDDELSIAVDRILSWAEQNPTCPTCGAMIDAQKWIDLKGADTDVQS
jgi:hypothetical protein